MLHKNDWNCHPELDSGSIHHEMLKRVQHDLLFNSGVTLYIVAIFLLSDDFFKTLTLLNKNIKL